jgi:thiol-disulfide isomerase/thioredoxin
MLNEYENIVAATIALLKQLKVKVNNATVDETIENHPDYPSMLSVADALTQWNIPNGTGKIEPTEIDQLPTPFIAHTRYPNHPLVVVNKADDNTIEVFAKSYNKPTSFAKEDFLKHWNGVYLLAEPNNHSGEKNYKQNKLNHFINQLIPLSAILLLATLSFLFFYHNAAGALSPSFGGVRGGLGLWGGFFISLAGVVITALLLWYEIDKNNPLLQKVCTGIIKGDCNAILTGKASKLWRWLSWSEVGFFYFAGSFLCIVFNPVNPIPYLFNLIALPYIIFSVYYQWRVAKQWCVLCLTVQGLLLLGGINIAASGLWQNINGINAQSITSALLLYLLPLALWYSIKPFVLKQQTAKQTKREYLRLKFNAEIFETLLHKQKTIEPLSVEGLGIDIGNPQAAHTIIKVCNPYCGPCAAAHPKIEKLIEENPNIKAKIIFTAPDNDNNMMSKPVKHLLAIAQKGNEQLTQKALDDWYLADKKDYDAFAAKYPMNGELAKQGAKLAAMSKWCKDIDVAATPTFFIDGNQMPDAYSIEDIQYFLLE